MIKNKTTQIVFQTIYCTLAFIGFIASFGLFNAQFNKDFYLYYTNLSNYICMVFMFVLLIKNIKSSKSKEDNFSDLAPKFNFMCVIMITITCLVYNFLLAGENSVTEYFTSLSNLLMHLILPIMFVLNWVLFYEHNKVKWNFPLYSTIIPLVYVFFVLVRAWIIGPNSTSVIYPYFFLNVAELGWGGFFLWITVLLLFFVTLGYILYALDNIGNITTKYKKRKSGK